MKVTFIGGGNMATALIGGMLKKGFAPGDIAAVEIVPEARKRLADAFGITVYDSVPSAVPNSDAVVLAVKPQQLHEAVTAAKPRLGQAIVLSIAAGIRMRDIARWLDDDAARKIVRCMPNTPALIGLGITAACGNDAITPADTALVDRILGAVGKVVWVEKEALLDPVTAVSGSGPAYVFYFLEAMQQAADEMGLPPAIGRELAMETFRGATELALRSTEPPAVLRERVTSRGGTTAAAIASMDQDQLKAAIVRALQAANRRAGELADEFGKL